MNIFTSRITNNQAWVWPVTFMSAVLGFMVMTAIVTAQRSKAITPLDADQERRGKVGSWDQQEKIRELSDQVTKLEKDKTALQTALSSKNDSSKVLNDQLQDMKTFAALTDIEGPGVVVTLRDAPQQTNLINLARTIHDEDVLSVLNELWIAGAEAMAVNGVRVSARSSFRCIGPVILVDGQRFATPVVIEAIGKTETLRGGLALPGGPIEALQRTDPSMASVEAAKWLRLPAYNGSTELKVGRVPKVKK